mgnify:CR=1 FL=1
MAGNRTSDAHIILNNIIQNYCHEKGEWVYSSFVDFSKAFDKVETRQQAVVADVRVSSLIPVILGSHRVQFWDQSSFLYTSGTSVAASLMGPIQLPLLMILKSGGELKLQMTVPNFKKTCSQYMAGLKTST